MPIGDVVCPQCGAFNPPMPHHCEPGQWNMIKVGRHQFTPNQLTADEVRKIIREELERAGLEPPRRD